MSQSSSEGLPPSGGRAGALPGVSYVMPVLNDVTHVRAAVDSLLAQDYAGPFEVAIALGPSIDGTTELVEELSRTDPRVRVIPNPVGSTPAGLNIAIRATTHPVVIRVDAHSVLPSDYARIAVETIARTGAANVGGIMDARGISAFERAVARAYGTKVGLGGTPHHVGGAEGPADTVYLGVFQRESLTAVGMFDERIKRGQDWELNHRLRAAGGTVWFTPELRVTYRPRPSFTRLARQFLSTGLWRGELTRRLPGGRSLRYFAPPVMVVAVVFGLLAGIVGVVTGLLAGVWWPTIGFVVPALYAVFVLLAAIVYGRADGARSMLWFVAVLPCIHFCWGIGFVLGYLSFASNISDLTNERGGAARDRATG